ncbi:MAG: pirin family protein [Pseudomonadota bacterium]|nr:pirin family protein [Pseudomonadota bacterium]
MIVQRPAAARGHVQAGWLDSRHTFSFGSYYDPDWMGFGALRVINEDRVDPGAGFSSHRHANMEILSYVLSGALSHQDSSGGGGVVGPGELQWMSAGHGVEHSEFNASETVPVHFLQIWLQPDRVNAAPAYAQLAAAADFPAARWRLLASANGADGSIAIRQDAQVSSIGLPLDSAGEFELGAERRYWLHLARGSVQANGHVLHAGDALGIAGQAGPLRLNGMENSAAEVLLFDLPQ